MYRMFRFFKKLKEDLRLSHDSNDYIKAKKTALVLLSLMLSLSLSIGLVFTGTALLTTFVATMSSFVLTMSASLLFFTNFKKDITNWIDDHITNPPRSITIVPVQANPDKVKELKEAIDNLALAKEQPDIDIHIIKNTLKQIFNLRSYHALTDAEFEEKVKLFKEQFDGFKQNIAQESDWKIKSNITALKRLTLDAVILSDALMAKIEQDIKNENQPVSTNQVAAKLTDANKGYADTFLYSALIGLYHFARGHAYYANSLMHRSDFYTETLPEFYQAGSIQNDVRKIYNTFIKHGFDNRYGGKAFRQKLHDTPDDSIEQSTRKDSKKTRKFNAHPTPTRR